MALRSSRKKQRRSKANLPMPAPRPTMVRRTARLGKRLALVIVGLLTFGVLVSAISCWRVPEAAVSATPDTSVRIDEVTRLHPVTMSRVVAPRTVEDIVNAVKATRGPVSIGGGRYSMGGQTATPDGLQLDMRDFRGVVALDTVGGALSVNAHGRYIGQGPLVRSVREITMVLADGRVVTASPTQNSELFYGAVGGYGALGVIAHVTLETADNSRVRRDDAKIPITSYLT